MYTSENTHRFPALVLAVGFTVAVMTGLSALAKELGTQADRGVLQSAAQRALVSDATSTSMRIDAVARS
jgi:hypothetical protein